MSAGAARLKHAGNTLREHWDRTREVWADRVAADFPEPAAVAVPSAGSTEGDATP